MEVINVTMKIDRRVMSMVFAIAGKVLDDKKWEEIFRKEFDLDDLDGFDEEERTKLKIAIACLVAANQLK